MPFRLPRAEVMTGVVATVLLGVAAVAASPVEPAAAVGIVAKPLSAPLSSQINTQAAAAERERAAQRRMQAAIEEQRAEERRVAAEAAAAAAAREQILANAVADPRGVARMMVAERGWGDEQFQCLDQLWEKESNWRWYADNPTSSAYGIPQSLPGHKMASAGPDWETNPATQITWGLGYIEERYGVPCNARNHSKAVNWY